MIYNFDINNLFYKMIEKGIDDLVIWYYGKDQNVY